MPYFLVGGESIYDMLRAPKFHLLHFTDESVSAQTSETSETSAESPNGDILDFHTLPLSPQASEAFGADRPFKVLLRPDNYIGHISAGTSSGGLKAYLNEVA